MRRALPATLRPLLRALPWALILLLPTTATTTADPLPGPGGLKPGCGYQAQRSQSCFRAAKAGPLSTLVCRPGDRSADPWLISSQLTGRPYTSYPDFTKAKVLRAARQRYALSEPRPPGFWPLGGFDGPWAEGFWTGKAALQFFWDHPDRRPPSLRLGSASEWDGVCTQREQYDLSAFGGRWIILEWQRVRDGGAAPAPALQARFLVRPAAPRVGQSVVFDGRSSSGAVGVFRWDFGDGNVRTGRSVRHSFAAAGRYSVVLLVEAAECSLGVCSNTSSQVVEVYDASGTPPPPPPPPPQPEKASDPPALDCGPHPTCIFLVTDGTWTRFIPDVSSTGQIVLQVVENDD